MLKVQNLSYKASKHSITGTESSSTHILSDISIQVKKGDIAGIAGESGSGKTTLARLIAGFIENNEGVIEFEYAGERRSQPIQLLFQNNENLINPFRSVRDIITDGIDITKKDFPGRETTLEKLFENLELDIELAGRKGYELSGGERMRVALARLLAAKPELLILDEPFAAQDVTSQMNLVNLLRTLNEKYNLTLIIISHNIRALKKIAGYLYILYKGRIIEEGTREKIFDEPESDYTRFLIESERYDIPYDEFIGRIHKLKEYR
jgi:peptide/nickel transport system ATP-binding protein